MQPRSPTKTVLHAAALQDHFSRLFQIPGRLPLPASPSSPTLAQRYKLVSGPVTLTPSQWQAAHAQSLGRGDSQHECSICLQQFKGEPQVLLSCSHVFHRQCLASFENYAQARCCPLCRCQAYQKKMIDDGTRFFREQCAIRIQAAYRAYTARKQFRALRELVAPQHPSLRRRWVADKLQRRTDKLVCAVEQEQDADIHVLFAELDATVRQSRAIYGQLDARQPDLATHLAATQPNVPMSEVLGATGSGAVLARAGQHAGHAAAARAHSSSQGRDSAADAPPSTINWEDVISRALDRDAECPECAICLAPLARPLQPGPLEGGNSRPAPTAGPACGHRGSQRDLPSPACSSGVSSRPGGQHAVSGGGLTVLSCSHAFHCDCLALFEAFKLASEAAPRCPCCRASYARIELQ